MPAYLGGVGKLAPAYIKVPFIRQGLVVYTVDGNPTIIDGVLIGDPQLSNSNRLSLGNGFNMATNDFEFKMKLKPGRWADGGNVFAFNNNLGFVRLSTTEFRFYLSSGIDIAMNTSFDENTYYYVRALKNGSSVSAGYSTNDESYVEQTATSSSWINFSYARIGVYPNGSSSGYNGKGIDLKETYIKVNGDAWFGPCKMFNTGKYNFRIQE